jgi:catechol 2,3-dioxygenase-like lactoylglutathione lyase family enzyme
MATFAFDHVGLSVADLDAQRRFYGEALGLVEEEGRVEIPAAQIRTVVLRASNGLKIELIERRGSTPHQFKDAYEGAGTQGYFHWSLNVDDLEAAFEAVLAAGATPVSAPANAARPGLRFAYVKDPEGNLIELVHAESGVRTAPTEEKNRAL